MYVSHDDVMDVGAVLLEVVRYFYQVLWWYIGDFPIES